MASGGDVVCTIGDVTLCEEDVKLLLPGQWLNDNLISAAFEHLGVRWWTASAAEEGESTSVATPELCPWPALAAAAHAAVGSAAASSGAAAAADVAGDGDSILQRVRDEVLFMHPSALFMSQFVDAAQLREILGNLTEELASRAVVFFPVNDNADSEAVGGSHWSLLVFVRHPVADNKTGQGISSPGSPQLLYWDSFGTHNLAAARGVASKFLPLLLGGRPTAGDVHVTVSRDAPVQTNGSDCGAYVIAMARHLCAAWLAGVPLARAGTADALSAQRITDLRKELADLFAREHAKRGKQAPKEEEQ